MNNLIVRGLIAWMNDGKRLTAIVLILLQYLAKWAETKGYPVPVGLAESSAGYIAAAVLTGLSKADVRVPVAPAPPTP
jgi:hypothetical protein